MLSVTQLVEDLSAFADLGADSPTIAFDDSGATVRMVRNGVKTELRIIKSGAVLERCEGVEKKHFNFRALLSSPSFADLGKWADRQRIQLQSLAASETIPVSGKLMPLDIRGGISIIDRHTNRNEYKDKRNIITIIDGPAGIGKTSLIRKLAFNRATDFRKEQCPVILHVESRGRVLQNISDLMAFSLQTLRLNVTYDQIPALVRNGLVQLAVDGFDELGDPNGYELAWAQVNELITSIRGEGNIILSGRDTFLSHDRTRKALTAIDDIEDHFQTFTLLPQTPSAAKEWLHSKGWTEAALKSQSAAPLFEPDSYALRPFFLSELSRQGTGEKIMQGEVDDILSFLIDMMVDREAGKFGTDIENITTEENRRTFIRKLMEETARDLADNQSSSLPSDSLSWLCEMVAHEIVPAGLLGILKNRSGVIAFLKDDDRRGYKSFIHDKVNDYFLSKSTINSITRNDIPKYIRRNVLSTDFLETFTNVFRTEMQSNIDDFFSSVRSAMESVSYHDSSRGNLMVLGISACCVSTPSVSPIFSDISIGEAYVTETVSNVTLNDIVISQLTARSADLRNIKFTGKNAIVSLVTDDKMIPAKEMPLPSVLELTSNTYFKPDEIGQWLTNRFYRSIRLPGRSAVEALKGIAFFDLLDRVARYKPFWIKEGDDGAARRILEDPNWPALRDLMMKHDLLVERSDVPSSGRPGRFYHVRNKESLSLSNPVSKEMAGFMGDFIVLAVKSHFPAKGSNGR